MNAGLTSLFLSELKATLPADALLDQLEDRRAFGSDWTKTDGTASVVVLPRSTQEVAAILSVCHRHRVEVVPSGGRTGLAGGAVAARGELVMSLSRMSCMDPVDTAARSVRVQAGVVTELLHEHCAKQGFTWPIDLASKGTSQIGGNLSTNAGGVRVIRYGMARKWVTGLQCVTMQGDILELGRGLEKNNAGYDLIQLIVGSEGTLAVITEATLKLSRLPVSGNVKVLFFSVVSMEVVLKVLEQVRSGPFEVTAFEYFSAKCLASVGEKLGRHSRLSVPGAYYVLAEIEAVDSRAVDEWLEKTSGLGLFLDGLVANSSEECKQVWGLREGITESLQLTSAVRKYDVSVRVSSVPNFLGEVEDLVSQNGWSIDLYFFGHLGDGSPHLNLLKPKGASDSKFSKDCAAFEQGLYRLLKDAGGSVSAEHGVGILKRNWLAYTRSPAELAIFRGIKQAFDPLGLLNPGKVIPE